MAVKNNISHELETSVSAHIDVYMFYALLTLCGLGFIMMTSTTVELGYRGHEDAFFYVKKQMMFMLLGALCVFCLDAHTLSLLGAARAIIISGNYCFARDGVNSGYRPYRQR